MDEIEFNSRKPNAPFPKLVPLPEPFKIPILELPFIPNFQGIGGIPVPENPTTASQRLERELNYALSKWQESFFMPGAFKQRRKTTKILAKDMVLAIKTYVESCEVLVKPGQLVDTGMVIANPPPPAPGAPPHKHLTGKTRTVGVGRIIDSSIVVQEIERHVDNEELIPDSKLVRQKFSTVSKDVDSKPFNRNEEAEPST